MLENIFVRFGADYNLYVNINGATVKIALCEWT